MSSDYVSLISIKNSIDLQFTNVILDPQWQLLRTTYRRAVGKDKFAIAHI